MGHHSGDFLVRPLDTVWFRGPGPFSAGEDSFDPGLFPPTQHTFQGLIRTRLLLAALPGDLDLADRGTIGELVGPPERLPGGWRLEGPFPARELVDGSFEPWFPAPRFLLRARERPEPVRARPAPALPELLSDLDGQLFGSPRDDAEALGGWLCAANLWWALTGDGAWDEGGYRLDLPPFVLPEERSGVRIDRETGTAADHLLYTGTHHRLAMGAGLLGRLAAESDPRVPDDALLDGSAQTGRKGRLVQFQRARELDPRWSRLRAGVHLTEPPGGVPDPLVAWVALLTPAPVLGPDPPFTVPHSAVEVRIRGRLTGEGPDLGGFDLAGGGGRPLRASWAAGSAWRVEIAGGSAEDRLEAARVLQGLAPHVPDTFEAKGFGQRAVGLLDANTDLPIRGGGDA